jgi:amino acid adenylation domain-containing protein
MTAIAERFAAQATRTPSRIAIDFDDDVVTYETLRARTNQLARCLARHGVGPQTVVGVCMPPSADLVMALLALATIDATYVGLDTAWPAARIAEAVSDAGAVLVIGGADDPSAVSGAIDGHVPLLSVASAAGESVDDLTVPASPDAVMSIAYTSGSMGKPKGVLVTIRSVLNRMEWMWNTYPFQSTDALLLYRSCASVGFSWDCFGGLLAGIPTVIQSAVDPRSPSSIVTASVARRVSHLTASAGLWEALLDEIDRRPDGWPSLRVARTTGEPLRPQMLERWRRTLPHATLLNIYGTTECSGSVAYDTTVYDATIDTASAAPIGVTRVPVGSAVPNVHVLVLDDQLRPLGPDDEGEVYVSGASLAHGYLGRPNLTAERFVPNPAGASRGERMFRTGDIGCWRADGTLDVIGRRDLQVKVRGFRVEIEEVEAALRRCPGVALAAVRAEQEPDGARLVALLVTRDEPLLRGIRSALAERLPAYMIPASFMVVDALPRTAAGKIDRRMLARCHGRALESAVPSVAPTTPSETAVASIWQDVLGLSYVGLEDDFFELGGHSLVGNRILSRVYDRFGVELPFSVFFEAQTVKALASQIDLALQSS